MVLNKKNLPEYENQRLVQYRKKFVKSFIKIYKYIYIFLFKVKFFNLALTIKTFLKSKII